MSTEAPSRVTVIDGDGQTPLGSGTLIGNARVYLFSRPSDGSLLSLADPEVLPPLEMIQQYLDEGCMLMSLVNPKIQLDSGRIVYGMQVWWEEVMDETSGHDHQQSGEADDQPAASLEDQLRDLITGDALDGLNVAIGPTTPEENRDGDDQAATL